jgi:aspartate/methionine/tyrosine aminotransferase
MFLPVQLAAAKALTLGKDWYTALNQVYSSRRTRAFAILDQMGCVYDPRQTGMFVWARIPEGYADGYTLSDEILYGANVFITPGGIFGPAGNGYVRVSLCSTEEKLEQALFRIQQLAIIN